MAALQKDAESEPQAKKRKLSEENAQIKLIDFIPNKILSNNAHGKSVAVLGTFKNNPDANAIIILEQSAFLDEEVLTSHQGYFSVDTRIEYDFINDIYHKFNVIPSVELNRIKATTIYPATQKHIEKYKYQITHLIDETAELYREITLPHIQAEKFSLDWVYNILDHKSEQERIVFEDPHPENGFILLPDLKWNGKDKENLHMLCLVHARNIKSIRDLNDTHLSLLRNILDKGTTLINDKYSLQPSQQRVFFHYQPSFYHLHIHFTALRFDAPGAHPGRAHLLSQVISNIELCSDYYAKVTIPCQLRQLDRHFKKFEDKKLVKKIENATD